MTRRGQQTRSMRLRRRSRWLWASIGAVGLAAGFGYLAWTYGWAPTAAVRQSAPFFTLEASDGRQVSLGDVVGRKPLLLVFYMTYG